ncbi:MAG TPA: hypothetical protein VLA19_20260 [Herpetosiphonaceae bacterium]|nr:hypothetical protein [Herpetosiphonaceae bacterium]
MAGSDGRGEEHADDVTELRDAQRMIAALRRQIAELVEQTEPLPNELSVFLKAEHARKLHLLFSHGKLFDGQTDDWEFEDACEEFVAGWIEVRWDMVADEMGWSRTQTPSA